MAVLGLRRTEDEGDIELTLLHQLQDVSGSALRHFDTDARMPCVVAGEHVSEETGQGRHMQPDPQASFLAARQCACCLNRMVKLIFASRYASNDCDGVLNLYGPQMSISVKTCPRTCHRP
ncbi:hypothetical protein NB311A_07058 [Nitrobacter sp. Nb-311A]|uniref:hypothetical protein n=1 Tax=unclassified Nitrobacter TaxID=2620411 RepID=UPI0000684B67|nr:MULTISPECIES: hypothetical protein [unclassified Nitrobacter]EAQ36888.1 hypothetical protein NB311A_07058 [Nitrobacter sp. Nb-311A]MCB1393570.1 hypothetical protein [Nitrobacter sp.]